MENPETRVVNQIDSEQNFENSSFESKTEIGVLEKQEVRQFTREYSPWARKSLADQIKYARTLRSLQVGGQEESEDQSSTLRDAFYERFAKQKQTFESSKAETSVENISKKYGVIFVHTFPLEGMSRWNTSANNEKLDVNSLRTQELVSNIIKNKPDLSCSSVSLDKRFSSLSDETMYPIGIVMSGGTILSAYRYDAGTLTEKNVEHKKSKYDRETRDTSIQENIPQKIDDVLTRKHDSHQNPETGFYNMHQNYKTGELEPRQYVDGYRGDPTSSSNAFDEFVIEKPKVDGLYINMDDSRIKSLYEYDSDMVEKINQFVQGYPDVPVYIKSKGKLTILTYDTEGNARVVDDSEGLKALDSLEKDLPEAI